MALIASPRPARLLRAVLLLLAALAALSVTLVTSFGWPTTAAATAPTGPTSAGGVGVGRGWGVAVPGVPADLGGLRALGDAVGSGPKVVMWYDAWSNNAPFPAAAAARVAGTGALPEVTWEPWNPAQGVLQPAYTDARIAAGAFDSYIRSYAESVAAYGKPVLIRFAQEANGTWYPWAAGVNGNTSAQYVAAFRHVHEVVAQAGASNARWAWTPNVPYPGSTDLAGLYPGDGYVDRVGLDGYNWGTTQSWSTWTGFWDIFGPGVALLQALSRRPIWIGEVASTETGGDKASWIRDMWAALSAHPEVTGFTWFDYDKETDWRIGSSAAALTAFATGAAAYSSPPQRTPAVTKGWSLPPVNTAWDDQLGGRGVRRGVRIVARDRHARPAGAYPICSVNAFQTTQPAQKRFWATRRHRRLLLRRADGTVVKDARSGEDLLDTRTMRKRSRLADIVDGWVAGCARAGFKAVAFDKLDSWTRSHRLLSRPDNVAYARLLTASAHAHGLAAAQENTVGLAKRGPSLGFDFAIAADCAQSHQCVTYANAYHGRVLVVEHTRTGFRAACRMVGHRVAVLRRDADLTPAGPYASC